MFLSANRDESVSFLTLSPFGPLYQTLSCVNLFHIKFAAFFTSLGFILVFLLEEAVEKASTSTSSAPLDIHHSHSDGFSNEQRALIRKPSRSRGEIDRMNPLPTDRYSSSGRIRVRKEWEGGRVQGEFSIGRVNSNMSTGSKMGGSISSIGRSVDENYHIYGSSPDSGYPSPIFIRKHYWSPRESTADLRGVSVKETVKETEATAESGVVFPGDPGGSSEGQGIGLSGETMKAGEGYGDLWASVGDSGGHVTTLRRDGGPARTNVKRLGSKVNELYEAYCRGNVFKPRILCR